MPKIYDAHCHPVEGRLGDCSEDIEMIVMTSQRDEWEKAMEFKRHSKAFGIHPWFAHLHEWDIDGKKLEEYLVCMPSSIVGEIGLDKAAKDRTTGNLYPFDNQVDIFCKQVDLAAKLSRPISVHAVQCHGWISNYFYEKSKECRQMRKQKLPLLFPPAVMMHSFSGSQEIMDAMIKLPLIGDRFFFSFSAIVNSRSPNSLKRIKSVPDDRLLIESDVGDVHQIDEQIAATVNLVAKAKGWTTDLVIETTFRNTRAFLGLLKK